MASARVGPALVVVVVLALVIRLGAVAATDAKPIYDAKEYDEMARSISSTGRYPPTWFAKPGSPAALRPPAYPYALGATYEIAGPSLTAGRILGAVLGAVTVGLLALIALRLWGPWAALGAGVLAAVYPPLVMTSGSLVSEALFIPFVLGLVLLLVWRRPKERHSPGAVAAGAGALCGLAALTRPVGLLLVIPALVWAWQVPLPTRRRLAVGALVLLATAATIAPWTIRNQLAFDAFVPISTQDGFNLAGTYNADAGRPSDGRGSWRPPFIVPRFRPLFSGTLDEVALNERLRSEALDYAVEHPGYPFVALGLNSLRLFGLGPGHIALERIWYGEMGIPRWAQPWTRWSVYLMTLLAAAGLLLARRRGRVPAVVWLVPLLLFLSVVFIHGGPRYRVPLDPFLVLAAAGGIPALLARRRAAD